MKTFGIASVCLLVFSLAHGQYSDSLTQLIRLSATGNLNRSNNVSSYLFNNDLRYGIRNKRTTLNASATWLYGQQASLLTNNDFNASTDFNIYRDSSKLYYWALGSYTSSFSLKINRQWQVGGGLGYNFFNDSKAWLNLSEGVLYETSRLTTIPEEEYTSFLRNSIRLAFRFVIAERITLNGSNFLQQALGQKNDYIIRTTNSVNVKLNKWVSLSSSVNYNQFKRTNTENFLFTYGVVIENYF